MMCLHPLPTFRPYGINNSLITMFPDVTDPTGNIVQTDFSRITLQPGYYLVGYSISAIYRTASYMQVTPSYNGTSHMETSVYFATSVNGTSAGGSANFIIYAPSETTLSLFYSSPVQATDGIFNMIHRQAQPHGLTGHAGRMERPEGSLGGPIRRAVRERNRRVLPAPLLARGRGGTDMPVFLPYETGALPRAEGETVKNVCKGRAAVTWLPLPGACSRFKRQGG